MSSSSFPLYKRLLFKIVAVIFIVYCLIWAISSPVIKHFAQSPLAEMGLTISPDASISFNPFLTRITVSDLVLLKQDIPVLQAEHIALQVALYKIPFDVVQLQEFSIDGVILNIEKNQTELVVAGINLTPSNVENAEPKPKETVDTATPETEPTEPLPYEIQLDELTLNNTVFDILIDGVPHKFDIKNLIVSNIKASQTEQSASLKLTSLLDNAVINLSSEVNLKNNQGNIKSSLKVSEYSLEKIKHFIEPLESLKGSLSFSSVQHITLTANGINLALKNTELNTSDVSASTKEENIAWDDLRYSINDLSLVIESPKDQHSNTMTATVKSTQLSTNNLKVNNKEQLASLNSLLYKINDLTLGITPSQVKIDNAQVGSKNEIKVSVKNTELTTKNIAAQTKEQHLNLQDLLYSMNDFSIIMVQNTLQKNMLHAINASAKIVLTNALVESLPNKMTPDKNNENLDNLPKIMSFEQLSLNNITPKLTSNSEDNLVNGVSVSVESIDLNALLFSQHTTNELPPVATIKNINITDMVGSAKALSINEINIDSLTSHIILNKEKALANLVNIRSTEKEKPETQQVKTTPSEKTARKNTKKRLKKTPEKTHEVEPIITEPTFYISLNAFNLINTNTIDFVDNSVNPLYKRSFVINELSMGKLSNINEAAQSKTPISLKGRSNKYANFNFGGFIQPFAVKKTYHIKGDLNELSLPDVSTYMKDALKLELKSGQLNTKVNITLVDDNIDGEVSININGLETAAANNHETNIVKDQVGIPFNAALGMLKDSNGDLILDVPLSGKTSDPSFGISSFIALITKKAVMSATQDYLMTTFVPYANIVSVAMVAGEFILKVRFEDLPYQPTQIELNANQNQYISEFSALMKDKKDTRVKICAITTPADIALPFEQKLTAEDIKRLKDIGYEREEAFKSHVVEKAEIESGRILLCAPQIDTSKNAMPRMVISV